MCFLVEMGSLKKRTGADLEVLLFLSCSSEHALNIGWVILRLAWCVRIFVRVCENVFFGNGMLYVEEQNLAVLK